jgi:hypothetical protein
MVISDDASTGRMGAKSTTLKQHCAHGGPREDRMVLKYKRHTFRRFDITCWIDRLLLACFSVDISEPEWPTIATNSPDENIKRDTAQRSMVRMKPSVPGGDRDHR